MTGGPTFDLIPHLLLSFQAFFYPSFLFNRPFCLYTSTPLNMKSTIALLLTATSFAYAATDAKPGCVYTCPPIPFTGAVPASLVGQSNKGTVVECRYVCPHPSPPSLPPTNLNLPNSWRLTKNNSTATTTPSPASESSPALKHALRWAWGRTAMTPRAHITRTSTPPEPL